MEINQAWIDQQRALCEAATQGPWKSNDVRLDGMPIVFSENRRICDAVVKDGQSAVDADFIAAARTALPAALDALEATQKEIARLASERDAEKKRADMATSDIKELMASCPSDFHPCDWCEEYDNGNCANREFKAGVIICQPKWRVPCALQCDENGV